MAWFEAFLLVTSCAAIFAQCYAIWLILKKSPVAMHAYRFFLVTSSASDLLFAFVLGILLHPDLLFPAPALIVQGLGRFFGPYGGIITVSMHFGKINKRLCFQFTQKKFCSFHWPFLRAPVKSTSKIGIFQQNFVYLPAIGL